MPSTISTVTPSVVAPVPPTMVPTTAPTLPSGALVGPEWTVAFQGDFDGNGRQDVIAFKPSSVRSSVNPGTVSFAVVVSEAVLVEHKADGTPWVRVLGDLGGLSIDGARVIDHTSSRPAAYMLALINDRRQFLLYPLDAQGQQTSYPIGAAYDQATGSYNRLGGEIPGGQPLLGAEWTVITSGDFDRNGRSDMIGYKPANVNSGVSTSGGYLSSEVVVAERDPSGAPVVRLLITRDGVLADNLPVASFGSGDNRPAGFIVRLQGVERKLVLTPLNGTGEQYAQDVAISYVDVVGRYVVAGPGGVLPLPLVGPEWTVALNGSFTPGVSDGVIAYKPANTPVGYMPSFDFFAVPASEFVLVDRAANGGAAVRLSANLDAISADGQPLVQLSQNGVRPSALLVRGSADRSVIFTLLNRDGMPFGPEFNVYWDSGAQAYRATSLGPGGYQPSPPVEPQTPVGFTELSRGDLNSDGLPDLVAYVPSELVLASGEVVAKELGI
ncbi:MAG: hypothetical protein EOM10_13830, partial [Opitutae bacterium]|nr:hypothetical protein [Opitutae bacterium]